MKARIIQNSEIDSDSQFIGDITFKEIVDDKESFALAMRLPNSKPGKFIHKYAKTFGDKILVDLSKLRPIRDFVLLHEIEVHPDVRRRGIGSKLIQQIYDKHPKVGIFCAVEENTPDLQSFYISNGFLQVTSNGYWKGKVL